MRKIAFLAIFLCVFACVFSQEPSNSVESENPTENVEENPEISQETPKSYENPEDYPENRVNPGPSDDFIREWESVMGDFIPEDISTFKMQGKSTEVDVFFGFFSYFLSISSKTLIFQALSEKSR